MQRLSVISYLSPSIPAGLYRLIGEHIRERCDIDTDVAFDERISGPLAGDEDPFADGRADVGFLCAPSYRYLRPNVDLLPVPVPLDARAAGRPVYFSDVIVPRASTAANLKDLRGSRWAFNDRNSKSGWFSLIDRIAPEPPEAFFAQLIAAGSHLRAIALVAGGGADAAAIDSNALRLQMQEHPSLRASIRIMDSWGPFAIQPSVIRASIDTALKRRIASALLTIHEIHGEKLAVFGFSRFVETDPALYT
ncbi:MAG: PhnD/SsuA/transferrin family substrate-binding protein [Thermoanaerobaculia bacterium]